MNHTSEDWDSIEDYVAEMRLRIDGKGSEQDTCVAGREDNTGHDKIPDGPFFWDSTIEVETIMKPLVTSSFLLRASSTPSSVPAFWSAPS